jgi:hypothetical protein
MLGLAMRDAYEAYTEKLIKELQATLSVEDAILLCRSNIQLIETSYLKLENIKQLATQLVNNSQLTILD